MHRRLLTRCLPIVLLSGLICYLTIHIIYRKATRRFYDLSTDRIIENTTRQPDNLECHFPQLDPYDPEILSYYTPPNPDDRLTCPQTQLDFTYVNAATGNVELNLTVYDDQSHVCSWRIFDRPDNDDFDIAFGVTHELNKAAPIAEFAQNDFIEVWCDKAYLLKTRVYYFIHARPRHNIPDILPTDETQLSVVLFFQDSLSHSSMIRQLPQTYRTLKNTPGSFVFDGYMKTGDNTAPNMFPVLAGLNHRGSPPEEVKQLMRNDSGNLYYDALKDVLLFGKFKQKGYAVSYLEDHPYYGLFHYGEGIKGFFEKPTEFFTHYYRPYVVLRDRTTKDWVMNIDLRSEFLRQCLGNEPNYLLDLDLIESTAKHYDGRRQFTFVALSELSHDYDNYVQKVDSQLNEFLHRLQPHLNHSVLIFMSDHGIRFGSLRSTRVGFMEGGMPFYSIRFPPWFLAKHPHIEEALRQNTQRLSTHFDTHETLLDIIHSNFKRNATENGRGMSQLFPIPLNRTCKSAELRGDYCLCNFGTVSKNEPKLDEETTQNVGAFIIQHLNSLTANESDHCARLELKEIDIDVLVSKGDKKKYFARLRTSPNSGEYETILRKLDNDEWQIVGRVSRTNMYGSQPDCVRDKSLREYCYCF